MNKFMTLTLISWLLITACTKKQPDNAFEVNQHQSHHLDLDLTSKEYLALLNYQNFKNDTLNPLAPPPTDPEDQSLEIFLSYGKKNLDWVDLINQNRPTDQKISFSSEATTRGYTVQNPNVYNFEIISEDWSILQSLIPHELSDIIFNGAPLTSALPVTEREFTEWLFQVDKAYQSTARYKLMKPYKKYLIQAQSNDIRGYLFFKNKTTADTDLNNWKSLSLTEQERYQTELIRICMNSQITREICSSEFNLSVQNLSLVNFKKKYFSVAENTYNSFFNIPDKRSDTQWTSTDPLVLKIPFTDPKNNIVKTYLQTNIENEWKWNGWQLRLDFVEISDKNTTHVIFVPGSTPHVNGIAGSEITMDANAPLSEYDVQWTIRHEYGHVLGFPDCYIEFYDTSVDAFTSYQLDVTDLMCSRRGHLKQRHYDELKKIYYKK